MTKEEMVALLREARESLDGVVDSDHPVGMSNAESRAVECIKRIDAALAENEAEEQVEVEWLSLCDGQENRLSLADGTRLYACSHGDGHWGWSVNRPSSYGYANTLDEAQRAALTAARGMR